MRWARRIIRWLKGCKWEMDLGHIDNYSEGILILLLRDTLRRKMLLLHSNNIFFLVLISILSSSTANCGCSAARDDTMKSRNWKKSDEMVPVVSTLPDPWFRLRSSSNAAIRLWNVACSVSSVSLIMLHIKLKERGSEVLWLQMCSA